MNRIKRTFLTTIKEYDMLCSGDSVTVAFSGGADSAALLVLLSEIKDELNLKLSAAHLNHMLRGEESNRDEQFARGFCENLGIPFISERIDIDKNRLRGESTETAARRIRYDFLNRAAGGGKIATAHNAGDLCETVLINMLRGSGTAGLCGIPPVMGNIIRPLIRVGSEDIREFCKASHIDYVVDSTNLTDEYTRNKLRHHVIPFLKEINPSLDKTVERQCRIVRQDNEFLSQTADDLLKEAMDGDSLITDKIRDLHPALLSRVLRSFAESCGITPDSLHTEKLTDLVIKGSGRLELPGGFTAELLKCRLRIEKKRSLSGFCADFSELKAEIPGRCIFGEILEKGKINNLFLKNIIDCDKIGENLIVRSRRDGDRLSVPGRNCTKTLRKLFNEAAVPTGKRDDVIVLADDGGILWVEGFGPDKRAAVDNDTKNILMLNIWFAPDKKK